MLTLKIFIIEHIDRYVGAALFNEEMHLAKFCFKEYEEDFVNFQEQNRERGYDYISPCFKLTYNTDRQATTQRIIQRRLSERNPNTPIMMKTAGVTETVNLIDISILK